MLRPAGALQAAHGAGGPPPPLPAHASAVCPARIRQASACMAGCRSSTPGFFMPGAPGHMGRSCPRCPPLSCTCRWVYCGHRWGNCKAPLGILLGTAGHRWVLQGTAGYSAGTAGYIAGYCRALLDIVRAPLNIVRALLGILRAPLGTAGARRVLLVRRKGSRRYTEVLPLARPWACR